MTESFAAPVLLSVSWPGYHTLPVPGEVAATLAASGTRRVVAVLNGHPVRRALTTLDGGTVLMLGRDILRTVGVEEGDTVFADLSPDPEPDRVDLGAEFEAALADDAEAAARFFSFTPGRQRSMAIYVTGAKRPETRVRRALELAHKLRTHTLYGDRPEAEPEA
ncbi:MAG TPA: YdeI/OmpD-associated family protein [Rubricoccaceae bacterium]